MWGDRERENSNQLSQSQQQSEQAFLSSGRAACRAGQHTALCAHRTHVDLRRDAHLSAAQASILGHPDVGPGCARQSQADTAHIAARCQRTSEGAGARAGAGAAHRAVADQWLGTGRRRGSRVA